MSSKCAANFVDMWCCSRKRLKGDPCGTNDSTNLKCIFESNVSACGKDILCGLHDEMSSWNVLICRKERQVHGDTAVGGQEVDDIAG